MNGANLALGLVAVAVATEVVVRARGSRSTDAWDFGFDDEPTVEVANWRTTAIRAFEAHANAPAEMIETSDLFREPPNGIDAAVYWVARYVRNATPGWLVLAPNVASETAARTLGTRVIRTLRAPRGLRADQIRLHGLALTVGWTGGVVRVGEEGSRNFTPASTPGRLLGYRLMRYDPTTHEAITRIGRPIRLPLVRGRVHRLPGKGMFLSNSEAYVRDYYAGHDHEVLLTYAFDPKTVTSGSMDDREPEITVPEATLVDWVVLAGEDE